MKRCLIILLAFFMAVLLVGCSNSDSKPITLNPNEQIIVENTEMENIIDETILTEYITSEIYLEEIIVAEEKISELLLEEEMVDEVYLCKTIYVPQDNIKEFAEHSQTSQLFGEEVDFESVLTKISVGTGVIVTIVVLKKIGLPEPVMSVVGASAPESLMFAGAGAGIGSIFGGLTGAADELDKSGRTSAAIGFAAATAGLILTIISLIPVIPSGGSTTITMATGIKLVIAGISVISATAGTAYSGYEMIKTYTSTDETDIDWDNIDWEKIGVSSVEKAINYGADGYMWGSIVGAVHGGAKGYDFYQKYNTPYTEYNARLMQTPKDGNGGKWSGKRGESDFVLDELITLKDGTKIKKVAYRNAVPDFSSFQKAQVKIPSMTNNRSKNFKQADKVLAEYWSKIKYGGKTWTRMDVEEYRVKNNFTWHEMSNMESMQLVPYDVNHKFTHYGGVAEYNAMIGQEGGNVYD